MIALFENWRIVLVIGVITLLIAAYFKGESAGKNADAAKTFAAVSHIKEKQDEILVNRPDDAAAIKRLRQHRT